MFTKLVRQLKADNLDDFEPVRLLRNTVTGKWKLFAFASVNDVITVNNAIESGEWIDDTELSGGDSDGQQ